MLKTSPFSRKSTFSQKEDCNSIVKNRVRLVGMFQNEEFKISIYLFD